MADTASAPTAQDSPASRQIRVFLSSTFRDFMEERDLLVKQVFPRLRKRAQERGVEVVDVDLRWGVTQEESEQGKVIGICLAEIDNCRPYFIGMLGERYGWIPPTDKYPALVLEQQAWLQQHVGGASVTELEILHGVLNDPKMAGRAFFYFRDPAWSRAQNEPGFVCDTPEEEAKLAALKERVLASDFPVKQGLPDPKAIADQIEADLWALIEEQFPDLDQTDALEREARKHASYRQSRLGVYLGQEYVDQLEALVSGGESKILITGESGSGKSALIANWMHQHELEHPGDVVYAHHLGCSNDANAIRPLLGRMLDTASNLLKEAELITEPIQVPADWWELTAKVAQTLQDLARWCSKTGQRWFLVLDGLDRLAEEDQQALPWLPLIIPEGVYVVISALDCPARLIVQERQFQLLNIGPLRRREQVQLIEAYLERYTKKLDADRVEQILACELARSPLFLRVLLEELRQCGRFESLTEQIIHYTMLNSDEDLTISKLFEKVLERLEKDCGHTEVKMVTTALWSSRGGLAETDLLAISGLAPMHWSPIALALDNSIDKNGHKLALDHEHLRQAIGNRYLLSKSDESQVRLRIIDWLRNTHINEYTLFHWKELLWQLRCQLDGSQIIDTLSNHEVLITLLRDMGAEEVLYNWNEACGLTGSKANIEESIEQAFKYLKEGRHLLAPIDVLGNVENLLELLESNGNRMTSLKEAMCMYCIDSYDKMEGEESKLIHFKELLAGCKTGENAYKLYTQVLKYYQKKPLIVSDDALRVRLKLAKLDAISGREKRAVAECNAIRNSIAAAIDINPIAKIDLLHWLGNCYYQAFEMELAAEIAADCKEACVFNCGRNSIRTLKIILATIAIYSDKDSQILLSQIEEALAISRSHLGIYHPLSIQCLELRLDYSEPRQQLDIYDELLDLKENTYGDRSAEYLFSWACLCVLHLRLGMIERSRALIVECYQRYCEYYGEDNEPTLALALYCSISSMLAGKTEEGLLFAAKSLMVPIHAARSIIKSMDNQTIEKIEDFLMFFGEPFEGSSSDQIKKSTTLLQHAVAGTSTHGS